MAREGDTMRNPKRVGPWDDLECGTDCPISFERRDQRAAMTSAGDSGKASCEAVLSDAARASRPPGPCEAAARSSSAPISVPNLRSVTASCSERSRLRECASSAALYTNRSEHENPHRRVFNLPPRTS